MRVGPMRGIPKHGSRREQRASRGSLEPREEALDFPAPLVASQRMRVLALVLARIGPVRGNQLAAAFAPEPPAQRTAAAACVSD
jgi:hypothetical protein